MYNNNEISTTYITKDGDFKDKTEIPWNETKKAQDMYGLAQTLLNANIANTPSGNSSVKTAEEVYKEMLEKYKQQNGG